MVARSSRDTWTEAPGVAAQALALQARAAPLARKDAEAWRDALSALARVAGERAGDPELELEAKLERAAAVPLEIAELGADTAALAAVVGELGNPAHQADVAAAAALAAGGARAAAHLVRVNLGVREGDERLARAHASEQAAVDAARLVLDSVR